MATGENAPPSGSLGAAPRVRSDAGPLTRYAWRIALLYLGFGTLWILTSDRTVFYFIRDFREIEWVNTAKGLFFVFTTAVLLWFLLRRLLVRLERSRVELLEREHQVRTIYHAVSDGILIVDPGEGRVLDANETACRMLGRAAETLRGLELEELHDRDDAEEIAADSLFSGVLLSGEPATGEWRCRKADGTTIWTEVSGRTIPIGGEPRLLITLHDVSKRRAAEEEIRESRSQLRALLTRFEETREFERRRISREVHDVLGQLLTSLKLNLGWIARRIVPATPQHAEIRTKIEESGMLADAILASIQEIAHDLRPGVLDGLGLMAALRFEAGRFTRRTAISCDVDGLPDRVELAPERATQVFRVVQEMLTNVARHALARSVRLDLRHDDGGLVLTVTDDGVGITETAMRAKGSLGLLGMSERAAMLGGTVSIRRGENGGTIASLVFPENP